MTPTPPTTQSTIVTGWSIVPTALEPWRAAWADASGHTVRVFDFHPYGTTLGIFPPFGHLPSPYAQALRESMHSATPQTLVGWSTGTLIALETAHFWPDAVSDLYLVGATACFCTKPNYPCGTERTHVRAMSRQLSGKRHAQVIADFWQRALDPARLETLDSPAAGHCADALTAAQQIPVPALQAGLTYLQLADVRQWCPEIRQPVHLFHGKADAVVPVTAAHWLADALPLATIEVEPRQGHAWPLIDHAHLVQRMRTRLP